jgi:hypothetical protein
MHFTALFAALAPTVLGLPQGTAPPSPDKSPAMTLQVSYFQASTFDTANEYANRTEFLVWDEAYTFGGVCGIATNQPLYADSDWHTCEVHFGSADIELSFYFGENFNKVGLKKGWDSNG